MATEQKTRRPPPGVAESDGFAPVATGGRSVSAPEFVTLCKRILQSSDAALQVALKDPVRGRRYNDNLSALIAMEVHGPINTARLAPLLRRASNARSIAAARKAEAEAEAVQANLASIEENFSRLSVKLENIHKNDVDTPTGQLQEQRRTFAEAVRKAVELAADIRSLAPNERAHVLALVGNGVQERFANAAAEPHEGADVPHKAPSLWLDRDEHSGETAIGFFQRVYAPWLDRLHLTDMSKLDLPLYQALQTWRRRHKAPAQLEFFFSRQRRSASEVDAELKKYNIKKPEDAFTRFPNDRSRAQRLYQACRTRLGLR